MKTITILGSTGSIGINTLWVTKNNPKQFRIDGLSAGSNEELLCRQVEEFSPRYVYIESEAAALNIQKKYGQKIKVFCHREGLREFCAQANSDILVAASSGTTALLPVMDAIDKGRRVALANKEILVIAGALVVERLRQNPRASLLPIDSEHSAIFQCLQGNAKKDIHRLILTSSGGPLRQVPVNQFESLSTEQVINHPKWKMGKKISVDSATLMNKGLEVIEARWLFDMPVEKIEVLVHPEAVIHSMVEFEDASVIAQLGVTDMKLPIQYALSYPERLAVPQELRLDFTALGSGLTFSKPDIQKFPCLSLAFAAAKKQGSAPCVLSCADEVVVGEFLNQKLRFVDIPTIIEKVLSRHRHVENPTLDDIQCVQSWTFEETKKLCSAL